MDDIPLFPRAELYLARISFECHDPNHDIDTDELALSVE